MTGRLLDGRYLVGRKIARGGMATVYEARDQRLDRACAVKIMHTDLGDDHDFAARFVREAHAAARLSHPNVVAVTDQGDDDGLLFIVMEHVPGRTLRDVIREQAPLPPARALDLLESVLLALAEAHRAGIIHRDVKPENVLIADDGRVKVADFGLARAFDANTQHTSTNGILIGTVSYLAPELIVSGRADPRSDVYAAGVLLYELLTGRKPHQGEGAIQIAFKHVNEDIPPPSAISETPLPAYLDALVLRATARERERRFADAKVFLQQARRVRGAIEAGAEPDAELTADLLPGVPGVADDDIDYHAETRLDLPAVDDASEDREQTSVIDARLLEATDGGHGRDATTTRPGAVGAVGALGAAAGAGGAAAGAAGTESADAVSGASAGGSATGPAPGAGSHPAASPAPHPAGAGQGEPGAPRPGPAAGALRGAPSSRPDRSSAAARTLPRPGADPSMRPRPRPARPRRSRRGIVLVLVVVLLVALVGYAGWWFGVGRYTSTPAVLNQGVSEARDTLAEAGLDLEVAQRAYSETVQAGLVISTDPDPGARIVEGGTVEVVVSRGPERYEVPKIRGRKASRVEPLLEANQLRLGPVTKVYDEVVPKGLVIDSSPAPGTELRPGSSVSLTVSKGPEPIEIPDFTGRNGDKAETRLSALGFVVDSTDANSDDVPKGKVISQSPSKGTGVKGDEIALVISKGPVLVEVPRLSAQSVDEATALLEEAGLRVAVVRTEFYISLDRVVRQSPAPGDLVPKGSTVTVYVV